MRAAGKGLAVTMLTAALAVRAHPGAAEEITLSVPSLASNVAQIAAAMDKGYFKEEGFDVTLTVVAGSAATAALISGSVPYSASPSSAVTAILKGADLKVILISHDRAPYTLRSLVPEIRTLEDIKGQPINITTRGGTQEIAVLMLLDKHKLPHNYVGFSPMGFGNARIAGLISGTQKIAVLSRSDAGQIQDAGKLAQGHLIADLNKELVLPTGGIATSSRELATNPNRARRFLRAVWKGTLFIRSPEHKEEAIDILRRLLPKASRRTVAADFTEALEDLDENGETPFPEARKELSIRAEMLKIAPERMTPVEKVYDFTLIREVIAALKGEHWTPGP